MSKTEQPENNFTKFLCPNRVCGTTFIRSLRAVNLNRDPKVSYEACPNCLVDISALELERLTETELKKLQFETAEETTGKDVKEEQSSAYDKPSGCKQHLNYLSSRSSAGALPEECVVCLNVVQCMLKKKSL